MRGTRRQELRDLGEPERRWDIARLRQGSISMSFIKGRAGKEANREWGRLIAQLNRDRGYTTLQRPRESIPKIPGALREGPEEIGVNLLPASVWPCNDSPVP